MTRDLRDPQKLGEAIEIGRQCDIGPMTCHDYVDNILPQWALIPVVAEADGIYVGPLARYGDPRK